MTKRRIIKLILAFTAVLLVWMFTQCLLFFKHTSALSEVYLLQRGLLHVIVQNYDELNDGMISVNSLTEKIDNSLCNIIIKYNANISVQKMEDFVEIIISGQEKNGKKIIIKEKFAIKNML